ncbi:AraC family transcriptional regulator [Desulfosporosinus sp.]|uniref:helix-turn-helix domain-containing protein n=1 Tax=Desulfosporosinus sp. TaxID=157907 RepID=UPI0025BA724B|nr:AraC family transcriptional regulator [Desulfosporosinus sp.]MBC2723837.1 helix-turn-helix transcriptional regulator [Desulfosporosinus sp.]MBC2726713.1 helix-turn-helix transcriptional regulator [Desulfosporosinus sp.]
MNQVETIIAVQKMQDYIEDHIYEEITLKQLSDVAGYSSWHTARIFKDLTGRTPFDYIRALRLTRAALVLRDEKRKIIDVALDFVFDSHEGFTRAFSKEFGLAPKRYSQNTPPIQLFMPERVFDTFRAMHHGGMNMIEKKTTKTVFVQIIERPARKVLLKRGIKATEYFAYCEEVGCDVWPMLTSVKEAIYEPIGMWLPEDLIKNGTSQYVQGVELPLDYNNAVPDGYELIDLPPSTMMIFQGEPYNDDDFMEAIGEIWEHIEKFDPNIYGYNWAPEAAPRFQLAPMGYRGYIEARPVVRVN